MAEKTGKAGKMATSTAESRVLLEHDLLSTPKDLGLSRSGSLDLSKGEAGKLVKYLLSLKVLSLREHAELTCSGRSKFNVEFSWLVMFSSLLYLFPAAMYFSNDVQILGCTFVLVTIMSFFSDSVYANRNWLTTLDRVVATVATIISPIRCALWTPDPRLRYQVVILTTVALSCLGWSRTSTNMKEFRVRHTVWHVASAMGLFYLAWQDMDFWFNGGLTPESLRKSVIYIGLS